MFSSVNNRKDFSRIVGIDYKKLNYLLYGLDVNTQYHTFLIPKKNGGTREINAPFGLVKSIQKQLKTLFELQQIIMLETYNTTNKISHGFVKDKSILTNANVHRKRQIILNIDLENFFDSFHFGRVRGYFNKNKFFNANIEVATIIAQLTCYNGSLPQGSSTSPIITNLIFNSVDMKIYSLAKKYKLDYTRYADDLTFSTNEKAFLNNYNQFLIEVDKIIVSGGFKVNEQKTRIITRSQKQIVTGLVVNDKVNTDRKYYRLLRSASHSLYMLQTPHIKNEEINASQLQSHWEYLIHVQEFNEKLDYEFRNIPIKSFKNYSSKQQAYQEYIFFKYFFNSSTPTIAVEGKTDRRYIAAALLKYKESFPNLIRLNEQLGRYELKFRFLPRTDNINKYLNVPKDGGSGLLSIVKFYSDKETHLGYLNYYKKFKRVTSQREIQPTIILLDNESVTKNTPLKTFINWLKLSDKSQKNLVENMHYKINADLYLVTNPLKEGFDECEIEDLFSDELLMLKIDNKTFNRGKSFDPKKNYSKEVFSQYVARNYESIDFSGLLPLLNVIDKIIGGVSFINDDET